MSHEPIHEATMTIKRAIPLEQHKKGGVTFELRASGEKLGELTITGAHVFYRKADAKRRKVWNFTDFATMLEQHRLRR